MVLCSAINRQHREDGLEADVVQLTVPKVILVRESLETPQIQVAESNLAGIFCDANATVPRDSVLAAADLEPIEVHVLPVEGDLQHFVQLGDRTFAAYE